MKTPPRTFQDTGFEKAKISGKIVDPNRQNLIVAGIRSLQTERSGFAAYAHAIKHAMHGPVPGADFHINARLGCELPCASCWAHGVSQRVRSTYKGSKFKGPTN